MYERCNFFSLLFSVSYIHLYYITYSCQPERKMLQSTALRVVGCNEFTPVQEVDYALEFFMELYGSPTGHLADTKTMRIAKMVKTTLLNIPSFSSYKEDCRASIKCDGKIYPPLFSPGQCLWCKETGWGFWPGTVHSINAIEINIVYASNEYTIVTNLEAPDRLQPFLETFKTHVTSSTATATGFENEINHCLEITKAKLPTFFGVQCQPIRDGERWRSRVPRIIHCIGQVLYEYQTDPNLLKFEKELKKRMSAQLSQRHLELLQLRELEKMQSSKNGKSHEKITNEQSNKLQDGEREKVRLKEEKKRKRISSLSEMLQTLESNSNSISSNISVSGSASSYSDKAPRSKSATREASEELGAELRNFLELYTSCKIVGMDRTQDIDSIEIQSVSVTSNQTMVVTPDPQTNKSKKSNKFKLDCNMNTITGNRKHNTLTPITPITPIATIGKKQKSTDYSQSFSKVVIKSIGEYKNDDMVSEQLCILADPLFKILLTDMNSFITSTHDIIFALENKLPLPVFNMLLTRYDPSEVYRAPGGSTLCHIAAKHNLPFHIIALSQHFEKKSLSLGDDGSKRYDLALLKDNHRRTPIHIACEYGSLDVVKLYAKCKVGDLEERDLYGYSPLLWCTSSEKCIDCGLYLIKKGVDVLVEDRKARSTIYYAITGGLVILGKALCTRGCWMRGNSLVEYVADMSLGREKHKIVFDLRSIEECRALYLPKEVDDDIEPPKEEEFNYEHFQNMCDDFEDLDEVIIEADTSDDEVCRNKRNNSILEDNEKPVKSRSSRRRQSHDDNILETTNMSLRSSKAKQAAAAVEDIANMKVVTRSTAISNKKKERIASGNSRKSSGLRESNSRSSSSILDVESSEWSIRYLSGSTIKLLLINYFIFYSDYMLDICNKNPTLIPKFVYSVSPTFDTREGNTKDLTSLCCDCTGNCETNPNCACLSR